MPLVGPLRVTGRGNDELVAARRSLEHAARRAGAEGGRLDGEQLPGLLAGDDGVVIGVDGQGQSAVLGLNRPTPQSGRTAARATGTARRHPAGFPGRGGSDRPHDGAPPDGRRGAAHSARPTPRPDCWVRTKVGLSCGGPRLRGRNNGLACGSCDRFTPCFRPVLFVTGPQVVNALRLYAGHRWSGCDATGGGAADDGPAVGAPLVIRLGRGAPPRTCGGPPAPRGIAGRNRTASDDSTQRAVAPARHKGARPHQEEL